MREVSPHIFDSITPSLRHSFLSYVGPGYFKLFSDDYDSNRHLLEELGAIVAISIIDNKEV